MASKVYELLTQVKNLCLVEGTTEDTKILQLLNQVQWDIYNSHAPWRALEVYPTVTTTASQAYVTVPSTLAMVYDVRQTSDSPYTKLEFVEIQKFHEVVPQPTIYSTGKPVYYSWWGGRFWLYPIPASTYTLTVYGYSKPVNTKLYSTGTAAHSGTTVTGTDTYFSNNANVDTNMYFAYQGDVRSDGTYPWSAISAVTTNTAMTIGTYAGSSGGSTVAYACSSAPSYSEDFDLLLIYGTSILYGGRLREFDTKLMDWLQKAYDRLFGGLVNTQTYVPDFTPILEDFTPYPRRILSDSAYKYPFIFRDI